MSRLQVFSFGQSEVRTVLLNDKPYFVGKDVAKVLGYSNTRDALSKRVEKEDKGVANCDTLGGKQDLIVINESGLYSLIFSSKLPSAKKFKRWVTSEVLPTIRKHGMYATEELLNNPDLLIQVATELKNEREQRLIAERRVEEMKPKALFADAVDASKTSILIGDLAKLIKQNGYDIGQNRLFEWLRNNGYLIARKGESYNMPTQRSLDLGIAEIKERTHNNPDGSIRISRTPKITGKGQVYFVNKFLG